MRTAALGDLGYPPRLRALGPAAPSRVWWRGVLPAPDARSIAVVGSRLLRPAGRRAAEQAVELAVRSGLVVVSGLSPGVDAAVHECCVRMGGTGLAIVGGGPDLAEDDRLAALAQALLATGGAVLAAEPPGVPVTPEGRVARCALQAAWADEVVVAQGDGPQDGTWHTVRAARRLHRPVVLAGPIGR